MIMGSKMNKTHDIQTNKKCQQEFIKPLNFRVSQKIYNILQTMHCNHMYHKPRFKSFRETRYQVTAREIRTD
jgi:hypothetical protein